MLRRDTALRNKVRTPLFNRQGVCARLGSANWPVQRKERGGGRGGRGSSSITDALLCSKWRADKSSASRHGEDTRAAVSISVCISLTRYVSHRRQQQQPALPDYGTGTMPYSRNVLAVNKSVLRVWIMRLGEQLWNTSPVAILFIIPQQLLCFPVRCWSAASSSTDG